MPFTVFLILAVVAAEAPRVSFIRPPGFVPEQEAVTYYVRVPRHADNRLLIVAAFDGDVKVSNMERELDGANAWAMWNVTWRLPAGKIALVAAVFDADGLVGKSVANIIVYERLQE